MQREILFRGKTVNGNDWVKSLTIANGTIKRKKDDLFMEISENKWVGIKKDTLGQFAGLTDKNGTKIFEGDVVYLAGYGSYIAEFPFIELYEAYNENDIGEILGNIHDCPDLI